MMNTAHFKKIEGVAQTQTPSQTFNGQTLNGEAEDGNQSVIKPPLSIFHNLPEISDSPQARMAKSETLSDGQSANTYEDGLRDGEAKATQIYADTVKLMETTLEALRAQYGSIRSEIEASHLTAVTHCLKALLPELATRSANVEISELIKSLTAKAVVGEIKLFVHPRDAEKIKKLCGSQDPQSEIFKITPDEQKVPNTLTAQWTGGGAKIDLAATVSECLSVLDQALLECTKA